MNTAASISALHMLLTSSKEPLTSPWEAHRQVQRMYAGTAIDRSTSAERFHKLSNVPISKSGLFDFAFNTESLLTFQQRFWAHLKNDFESFALAFKVY